MDLLSIGVMSASVVVGLGGASLAALKAWAGWLELKKMELTADRRRARTSARKRPGSRLPIFANGFENLRRLLLESTSRRL